MKILHVVRQFNPSIGGLEDYVYSLALEQIKAGYSVDVLTANTNFQTDAVLDKTEEINGITVNRLSWSLSKRYPIIWIKPGLLNQYDLVHIHAVDFFIDYISLLKKLRLVKSKVCLTTHGGFFHTPNQQGLKKFYFKTVTRFSLMGINRVFTISSNDQNLFNQIKKGCQLVANGVRLQKFGPKLTNNLANAPDSNGSQSDLICLGRFSSNKKIAWLIQAYALLQNPQGKLKIIGGSATGDTAALQNLITQLNAEDKIELLLDIPDSEILAHISAAKFVVSASEYEGFGLSVVELMSYGLIPFLSDKPDSFVDFINQSECGVLFDYNLESFQDKYNQLLACDNAAEATKALDFSQQFSWSKVAKQINEGYKDA
ncbi:MAG: glycosyltransferase [Pseudomonadota bacterium]|nr:glycosyltransferase [Pseudomonadota bacterium]